MREPSTASAEARSANVRDFEKALRTLRPLTLEEMGSALPPPEQVTTTVMLGSGIDAVPAVVDLLEEIGVL